jgi:hypothetical protein
VSTIIIDSGASSYGSRLLEDIEEVGRQRSGPTVGGGTRAQQDDRATGQTMSGTGEEDVRGKDRVRVDTGARRRRWS